MSGLELALGISLVVIAVALIIVVLLQDSKSHNMSGVISGGAENLFGQSKGKTISNKLNKVTIVLAALLVVIVVVFYLQQFSKNSSQGSGVSTDPAESTVESSAETTEAPVTTEAE